MSDTSAFGRILDPIISNVVNPIVMLMFAIGLLVFAYGVFEMIWKGGDADARSKGKMHMLGGVIGMFVMLSAWGLINLVANTVKSF
jgi:hypothetical protein